MAQDNRGWQGDSDGHAKAGQQSSGNQNAGQNLTQDDQSKGGQASHEQGTTQEYDPQGTSETGSFDDTK